MKWVKQGDLLVMLVNGWMRAVIYYEGGWWGTGIFDIPGKGVVSLYFNTNKGVLKNILKEAHLTRFGPRLEP